MLFSYLHVCCRTLPHVSCMMFLSTWTPEQNLQMYHVLFFVLFGAHTLLLLVGYFFLPLLPATIFPVYACWSLLTTLRADLLRSFQCRLVISELAFCGSTTFVLLFCDPICCCFMKEFLISNFDGGIQFFINTGSTEKITVDWIQCCHLWSFYSFPRHPVKTQVVVSHVFLSYTCFIEQCSDAFWPHLLFSCPWC